MIFETMTLSTIILGLITFSTMILVIMTFGMIKFSIITFSIMPISKMRPSTTALSIKDTQNNGLN
jgi:hypothetical protein